MNIITYSTSLCLSLISRDGTVAIWDLRMGHELWTAQERFTNEDHHSVLSLFYLKDILCHCARLMRTILLLVMYHQAYLLLTEGALYILGKSRDTLDRTCDKSHDILNKYHK